MYIYVNKKPKNNIKMQQFLFGILKNILFIITVQSASSTDKGTVKIEGINVDYYAPKNTQGYTMHAMRIIIRLVQVYQKSARDLFCGLFLRTFLLSIFCGLFLRTFFAEFFCGLFLRTFFADIFADFFNYQKKYFKLLYNEKD